MNFGVSWQVLWTLIARAALVVAVVCGAAVAGVAQSSTTGQPPPESATTGQPPAADAQAPETPAGGTDAASDLANQLNNPAAPVTVIQFRDIVLPHVTGADGAANLFEIQPVLPIGPFHSFPFTQIVKITIPFESVPSPVGQRGLGDVQLFDLISIKESWGRWGFGPTFVFPTATSRALGAGKLQIGPSAAVVYTGAKNLTIGAILQNPISVAGSGGRPGVNQLLVTPTFTYTFDKGWFAGLSDFDWTFDWKNGGATTFPVGFQIGRVVKVGKQPVSFSIEVGGTPVHPAGTPNPGWIIGIEITPIFVGHHK